MREGMLASDVSEQYFSKGAWSKN